MSDRDTDTEFLRRAVAVCEQGIAAGQSPFGAVVVRDDRVIASAHNTVWRDGDPTAHAEVNALRAAAASLKTPDLSGCTLYSTCEPCPMCLAASHWAKFGRVVFGASIADATAAGFSELPVPASTLAAMGRSPLRVEGGVLREECADLFRKWREAGLSQAY
jgi:tRNA(Arg) A34 adenosine deaminase TadA